MSLDATDVRLTKIGKVEIDKDGFVTVSGFEGKNCSCRDVAVLAMVRAIRVLSKELEKDIQTPGGGNCGIG